MKNLGLYNETTSVPRKQDIDSLKVLVDTKYGPDNPVDIPVSSVNEKTGAVTLAASDVGAISTDNITQTLGTSTTKVPSEKAVKDALAAAGTGDMLKASYDADGTVATAGGIKDYVDSKTVKFYLKVWTA